MRGQLFWSATTAQVLIGEPALVVTNINAQDLPASSSGAYIGKRQKRHRGRPWMLEELKEAGHKVHAWDGR